MRRHIPRNLRRKLAIEIEEVEDSLAQISNNLQDIADSLEAAVDYLYKKDLKDS